MGINEPMLGEFSEVLVPPGMKACGKCGEIYIPVANDCCPVLLNIALEKLIRHQNWNETADSLKVAEFLVQRKEQLIASWERVMELVNPGACLSVESSLSKIGIIRNAH